MCEICHYRGGFDRREFLKIGGAAAILGSLWRPIDALAQSPVSADQHRLAAKKRTRVTVIFMYPPEDVVLGGKLEDWWSTNHQFADWPGHQYEPEKNHEKFRRKIEEIGAKYDLDLDFRGVIYTKAQVSAFVESINAAPPEALLIVNFWRTFSGWINELMLPKISLPMIIYQPVGVTHQLPSGQLRNTEGVVYIHSVENWEALENALAAANAKQIMARSRLLRVAEVKEQFTDTEKNLGVEIVAIPAEEYNKMFDSVVADDSLKREAMAFKAKATAILDVNDHYMIEAFRARKAISELMKRYDADSITIKCLMLKERKPCVAFALNNSALIPCACEDETSSAFTLMIGTLMFQRGGFMHNPDFDLDRNQYYASHCTCPIEMHGPGKGMLPFNIRPFLHQLPKTAAVDVQMTPDEKIFLTKYSPKENLIRTYTGTIVGTPEMTVAAGCATRCIFDIDKIDKTTGDVSSIYLGPHPIMYCGNAMEAKRMKAFAKLTRLQHIGNI